MIAKPLLLKGNEFNSSPGLNPIPAAITHIAKTNEFSPKQFIIFLRQLNILEEAFAGSQYSQQICSICYTTESEKYLFPSSLLAEFRPRSVERDVFGPLIEKGYFEEVEPELSRKGCYKVKKSQNKIKSERYLVDEFNYLFESPEAIGNNIKIKGSIPISILSQLVLSSKLNVCFSNLDQSKLFKEFGEKYDRLEDYHNVFNMSFIGAGPKQNPENRIIYFISYYRNEDEKISLTSLNEDLSKLIKISIKNDFTLKNLIQESGQTFNSHFENEIFLNSLTVDIPKTNLVNTIIAVSLSKEARKATRTNDFPLKQMYSEIYNHNRQVYFNRHSMEKIKLD